MKKIISRILGVLSPILLCSTLLAIPVQADNGLYSSDKVYFYDEANYLSNAERDEIIGMLEDTAEDTDMCIGFELGSQDWYETETEEHCDDTFDTMFGTGTDGVYLYLDFSGADDLYDYLSTSGLALMYYTNDRATDMVSDIEDYLPRGSEDVYSATEEFCSQMKEYYNDGVDEGAYYWDNEYGCYISYEDGSLQYTDHVPFRYYFTSTSIISGIIVGLIIALCTIFAVKKFYQFKQAESVNTYLEFGRIQFTAREDMFLKQYTTKTHISSDSGGGGGGFSSSGGHGGGGGHR